MPELTRQYAKATLLLLGLGARQRIAIDLKKCKHDNGLRPFFPALTHFYDSGRSHISLRHLDVLYTGYFYYHSAGMTINHKLCLMGQMKNWFWILMCGIHPSISTAISLSGSGEKQGTAYSRATKKDNISHHHQN